MVAQKFTVAGVKSVKLHSIIVPAAAAYYFHVADIPSTELHKYTTL